MPVISFTSKGFYCEAGDFYIDPWLPVHRAVITHAHSDHARRGSDFYLSTSLSEPLLRARLGIDIQLHTLPYGKEITMGGAKVSLHPAGHIVGSAQVRVEVNGEVWVASGDYKLENDGVSTPFEPVRCNAFITESTFGLPIYKWKPQPLLMQEIHEWILANREKGRNSVLTAYTLGKSQRLIRALSDMGHRIFVHGATYNMQEAVRKVLDEPAVEWLRPATPKAEVLNGVIICPGSAVDSPWIRRWQPFALGSCSGWMQVRGAQRRRNADAGFPLSDHADWPDLLTAIEATGAEKVFTTHGFSATLARYLAEEKGLYTEVVKTQFGEEEVDEENLTEEAREQAKDAEA